MRKAYCTQARLDCDAIASLELNLQCRDEIIPILSALKHITCRRSCAMKSCALFVSWFSGNWNFGPSASLRADGLFVDYPQSQPFIAVI
jgi:hypothetical protein